MSCHLLSLCVQEAELCSRAACYEAFVLQASHRIQSRFFLFFPPIPSFLEEEKKCRFPKEVSIALFSRIRKCQNTDSLYGSSLFFPPFFSTFSNKDHIFINRTYTPFSSQNMGHKKQKGELYVSDTIVHRNKLT